MAVLTANCLKPQSYEQRAAKEGLGVDPSSLKPKWEEKVKEVFGEGTLPYPNEGLQ